MGRLKGAIVSRRPGLRGQSDSRPVATAIGSETSESSLRSVRQTVHAVGRTVFAFFFAGCRSQNPAREAITRSRWMRRSRTKEPRTTINGHTSCRTAWPLILLWHVHRVHSYGSAEKSTPMTISDDPPDGVPIDPALPQRNCNSQQSLPGRSISEKFARVMGDRPPNGEGLKERFAPMFGDRSRR